ncbi:nucleotide sugar dehydrogenase [Streptomyces sp. NPDC093224]|uniref:nucleotide sugar dehydrogenase n=1 Tax=Streptomyces sp. NPDC093224 TaxID=3155198 RepID=UPI003426E9F5
MTAAVADQPVTVWPEKLSSVAIIGMGYVGLPTALGLHAGGIKIIGIDRDQRRLDTIRSCEADLIDADLRRLEKSLPQETFELTSDVSRLAEADAVMVCVPTPVDRHLMPDLAALEGACAALLEHARPGQTLVLTSTSFVGTTKRLLVDPLTARGFAVGEDIAVASSPERIDPGNVTHTQAETPRVVGGVTPSCARRAGEVISILTPAVHTVGSPEAAEMTKLYENSFRAVNIALANEFAEVCAGLSLDPIEVTEAAATKPYGFMKFSPGPGVGGHCIPCDPHYLLWQLRASRGTAPLLTQAMLSIAERPGQVVGRLMEELSLRGKGLAGTRVVLVGVAYKPGVQDVRSSSALDIIGLLTARGAHVEYFDPLADRLLLDDGTTAASISRPRGEDWDVALIHTTHPGHDYTWVTDCPIVVDATYRFDPVGAA